MNRRALLASILNQLVLESPRRLETRGLARRDIDEALQMLPTLAEKAASTNTRLPPAVQVRDGTATVGQVSLASIAALGETLLQERTRSFTDSHLD